MNYNKQLNIIATTKSYLAQKPTLRRIKNIFKQLNHPQRKFPIIHIAGTNGKGSIAAMLHAILVAAGFRVGLYTSPHFIDCRERIRINHKLISKRDLESVLKIIFQKESSKQLTYFEILTAAAFHYFAAKQVDLVVCEVGLGGRFDATNATKNKLVNIITSIDFDHTEFLGETLEAIAKEKCGIITTKVPTIAYSGHKEADPVIAQKCRVMQSPCYFLKQDFRVKDLGIDWLCRKQLFSYRGINGNYKDVTLNLLGKHQVRNAGIVLACIEILRSKYKIKISDQAVYRGLKNVYWPGRFEIFNICRDNSCRDRSRPVRICIRDRVRNRKPIIILDGSHNIAGAKALKNLLAASPYAKNLTLVMSMLRDKDYRKFCKILSTVAQNVIIFKVNSPRALQPEILVREWRKYLPKNKIFSIKKFSQLFALLKSGRHKTICITGSLYAVGSWRSLFQYKKTII